MVQVKEEGPTELSSKAVATAARLGPAGLDKVVAAIDALIQQLASEGYAEKLQKESCAVWAPRDFNHVSGLFAPRST